MSFTVIFLLINLKTMQNSAASRRTVGILIACGGVLAVSPDAMLLRWMRSLGASSPDVAMAKYIGIIICMLIIGSLKGVSGARVSCVHFVSSALAQLLYQLSFTFCLLLTDALYENGSILCHLNRVIEGVFHLLVNY